MVGVRGFEPPASASRTQRSSQTEPHPDFYRKTSSIPEVCLHNISPFHAFASAEKQNYPFLYKFFTFHHETNLPIGYHAALNNDRPHALPETPAPDMTHPLRSKPPSIPDISAAKYSAIDAQCQRFQHPRQNRLHPPYSARSPPAQILPAEFPAAVPFRLPMLCAATVSPVQSLPRQNAAAHPRLPTLPLYLNLSPPPAKDKTPPPLPHSPPGLPPESKYPQEKNPPENVDLLPI